MARPGRRAVAVGLIGLAAAACGLRAPPPGPYDLEPEAPEVEPLRQEGGEIEVRWTAPTVASGRVIGERDLRRAVIRYRLLDLPALAAEQRELRRQEAAEALAEDESDGPDEGTEETTDPPHTAEEPAAPDLPADEPAPTDPPDTGEESPAPDLPAEEQPPADPPQTGQEPPAPDLPAEEQPPADPPETGEEPPAPDPPAEEQPPADPPQTGEDPPAPDLPAEEQPPADPPETGEEPPAPDLPAEEQPTADPPQTGEEPPAPDLLAEEQPPADPPQTGEEPPAPDLPAEEQPPADPPQTGEEPPAPDPPAEEPAPTDPPETGEQPPDDPPETDPDPEEQEPAAIEEPSPTDAEEGEPQPEPFDLELDDIPFEQLAEVESRQPGEDRVFRIPVEDGWAGQRIEITVHYETGGEPGEESDVRSLDVGDPLPAPGDVSVGTGEHQLTVQWSAVPPPGAQFQVARRRGEVEEIAGRANEPPFTDAEGVRFGEEVCYRVRLVVPGGEEAVEIPDPGRPEEPSGEDGLPEAWAPMPAQAPPTGATALRVGLWAEEACVAPLDIYPPFSPTALRVVWRPDRTELSWEPPSPAPSDLGGYHVYRAAPGEPGPVRITKEPVEGLSFDDADRDPESSYEYSVTAVDSAAPPNESRPSPSVPATPPRSR